MAERGRFPALLAAAGLIGLAGCAAVAPPVADAPGSPAVQTAAKPAGFLDELDPRAAHIEARPADVTAPTRTEQVLLATVVDAAGRPLAGRRVEWTLEGPGAIVAVDERGRLLERGGKLSSTYAVAFTEHFERRVTRANPPAEFTVGRGQSWCVVTSAEESATRVTAYAPEVGGRGVNRIVLTQRWGDADWTAPAPAAGAPGSTQFLSASVFRRGGHEPLAGYAVRYRILDGPPALFQPSQTAETVVNTNTTGVAPVVVSETATQPGRTRIAVDLLGKDGTVVGSTTTYADWQGPDVSLSALFQPTAAVGQEAPLTLTVNNGGGADAKFLTVRAAVPDGCRLIRSDPPADQQGNELVWTLGSVAGRSRRMLQAVFATDRVGPLTARASLTGADGGRDDKTAVCNVTAPAKPLLQVSADGPQTAVLGGKVTYQVTVRNTGTGPAANVMLKAEFAGGLQCADGGAVVERAVGTLAAGESRTAALPAVLKQAGAAPAAVTVTAVGDGGLAARAARPLTVHDARMTLRLSAPARAYVGRPAVWTLELHNVGDATLSGTTVSDALPPGLAFMEAMDGGRLQGNAVVWNVGDLPPGGQKVLRLTTTSTQPVPEVANTATATAQSGVDVAALRVQASATMAVLGLPGYKMTVEDRDDPVTVGGRTAYRIQVKNTGSLPGDHVQVTAVVPPQMRLVTASGPTTYAVDGVRVTFTPLATLPPGQTATYIVEVEALQSGEARFRAELTTATMREPVVKEESTNVR